MKARHTPPYVSVIIPVINDPGRLHTCLHALENQTYPKNRYEVIVVDNGSSESIEPIVAEFTHAIAAEEFRIGSYAARNKGLSLAKGHVIAFTDSDCIPAIDWIEKGVGHLLATYNCGIVGGRINLTFKSKNCPTAIEIFDSITFFQQKTNIELAKFSVTANLFTSKEVFDHVGVFDAALKSGGDREWGNRVHSSGYKLYYADDTIIFHQARNSFFKLYKKTMRVAEGLNQLSGKKPLSFMSFFTALPIKLLPPISRISSVYSHDKLNGITQKTKAICILLLFKYLWLWQEIRIYFTTQRKNK